MKKLYLILICAFLACNHGVSASSFLERENAYINIKIKDRKTDQTHTQRAPAKIPIEASYNSFISGIAITFLQNLGNVEVNVTNCTTGEYLEGTMTATAGVTMLPISGTEGFYTITFTLSDGTEYYGEFEL